MRAIIAQSFDGLDLVRRDDSVPEPTLHETADAAIAALLPHATDRFLIRLKTELIPDERFARADRARTPVEIVLLAPELGGEG